MALKGREKTGIKRVILGIAGGEGERVRDIRLANGAGGKIGGLTEIEAKECYC